MTNQTSEMMKRKIKAGQRLLQKINQQNYEAYFVGGFVRDHMLQRFFQLNDIDVDIATNMPIDDVIEQFKTIYQAQKYGVVCIEYKGFQFEITHFRKDGTYSDYRHPDTVAFTEKLIDDVKRRDFTINGLAMDEKFNVIDYVDGCEDLNKKVIRTIGDSNVRFGEDSLRIIRAIRFASNLRFSIDHDTGAAIYQNRHLIKELPLSRIRQEFEKVENKVDFMDYIEQFALDENQDAFFGIKSLHKKDRKKIQNWDDYVFFQLYRSLERSIIYKKLLIGQKQFSYYERIFMQIESYHKQGQNSWWSYQLNGQIDVFKFLAQIDEKPYNEYIDYYQKEAIKTWKDISFDITKINNVSNEKFKQVKETIAYDIIHKKVQNETGAIMEYIEEVYGWKSKS